MRYLICSNICGATLSSSTPRPSNSGMAVESPAISPHTPVQMPWRRPASMVICSILNIAGCVGSYKSATFSLRRSTASVYCMRSLVPMLKNSARLPSVLAVSTADGISTMMPTSRFSSKGMPSARSSSMHSASRALASVSSSTPEIIGYISFTLPAALARRRARSCTRKISLRARQKRIARQPRKGLASSVSPMARPILSAPISSVRKITGSGASACATRS